MNATMKGTETVADGIWRESIAKISDTTHTHLMKPLHQRNMNSVSWNTMYFFARWMCKMKNIYHEGDEFRLKRPIHFKSVSPLPSKSLQIFPRSRIQCQCTASDCSHLLTLNTHGFYCPWKDFLFLTRKCLRIVVVVVASKHSAVLRISVPNPFK